MKKTLILNGMTLGFVLTGAFQAFAGTAELSTGKSMKTSLSSYEARHAQCISEVFAKTMSKVTCNQKVDFEATNLKIKHHCDIKTFSKLGEPKTHAQLNDQRNLHEKTALKAYSLLEDQTKDIQKKCDLSKNLKQEFRKTGSDVKFVNGIF